MQFSIILAKSGDYLGFPGPAIQVNKLAGIYLLNRDRLTLVEIQDGFPEHIFVFAL